MIGEYLSLVSHTRGSPLAQTLAHVVRPLGAAAVGLEEVVAELLLATLGAALLPAAAIPVAAVAAAARAAAVLLRGFCGENEGSNRSLACFGGSVKAPVFYPWTLKTIIS